MKRHKIEGNFTIEYSSSSFRTVVFRKYNYNNAEQPFFDLHFSRVIFLQVPTDFSCFEITEEPYSREKLNYKGLAEGNLKTYTIKTSDDDYYIVASRLLYGDSKIISYPKL